MKVTKKEIFHLKYAQQCPVELELETIRIGFLFPLNLKEDLRINEHHLEKSLDVYQEEMFCWFVRV